MNHSFKLITVLGIPVEVNFSWFIIFGLVAYTLAVGYFPVVAPEFGTAVHWAMAAVAALLLFSCLLLHELSHSYVAKKNNLPIAGITLFIFGGVAHLEKEPTTPGVEFKMAAAGPLMSIFLGIFFFALSVAVRLVPGSGAVYAVTDYLSFINVAVALFNLIPGFPLDGGRLFRSAFWHFSGDLRRATYIASSLGKGFAYFMIASGFFNLVTGNFISGDLVHLPGDLPDGGGQHQLPPDADEKDIIERPGRQPDDLQCRHRPRLDHPLASDGGLFFQVPPHQLPGGRGRHRPGTGHIP